ncbi:uncharacterized protein LOC143257928 [Tachypleus tridentatus]|uniref:uncharacterized protein LOC143257928 n=1 Tax=Tachypleus tridentatus TaxID=6853 RepID=UPI003FD1BAC4
MLETISTLQERLWNAFTNFNWVLSPTLLALLLLNIIGSLYDGHKIPLFIAIFFRVIVALLFSVSIVNIPSYYMAILAVLCISDEYLEIYENLVHCELDGDESTISDECPGNYDWIQGLDTSDDEARETRGITDLDEARKKV